MSDYSESDDGRNDDFLNPGMFHSPIELLTVSPAPATIEIAVSEALSHIMLGLIKVPHFVLGPIGPSRKLSGRQQSANEPHTSANGAVV